MTAKIVEKEMISTVDGKVVDTTIVKLIGRKKVPISADEVYSFICLGCTETELAEYYGIARQTLSLNFGDQIVQGRFDVRHNLRQRQLQVAMDPDRPNPTMLIWLGKQMLGQRDGTDLLIQTNELPSQELEDKIQDLAHSLQKKD